MVDFTSILSKPAEAIEKPKPKPVGHYLAAVQGLPQQKTVTAQGEERAVLSFKVKILMAREVEDQEALAASGDPSSWAPLNYDIWVDTPEGEWQLRKFLTEVLGIEASGKSLGQMVGEAPGSQLLVKVGHRPYQNKQTGEPEIATQIDSVAHV